MSKPKAKSAHRLSDRLGLEDSESGAEHSAVDGSEA